MEPESRPPASRPSFTAFWKRTKDAASAAAKQVTFVSGSASGRRKGRNKAVSADPYADEDAGSSGEDDNDDDNDDDNGESTTAGGSALTKAQARRAQVRRAQVQHRKRKADYLRQLEVDVSTLRDLITTTEKEGRKLRHENDRIRVRLGMSVVGGSKGGGAGGSDIVMGADTGRAMAPDDVPRLVVSSASVLSPAATPLWDSSTTTTGPSPLSLSSSASPAAQGAMSAAVTETTGAKVDSAGSLFADIDLDDITVNLVMDELVGTPVYRISSSSVSSSSPPYGDSSAILQSFPVAPISPSPGFDSTTTSTTLPFIPSGSTAPVLPESPVIQQMTLDQVHMAVNFILALEHVCWNHAGHQFCNPPEGLVVAGHTLMATNLLLGHAPDSVHKGVYAINDKDEREMKHQVALAQDTADAGGNDSRGDNLAWQAPDVSLHSLYGLATSLNPSADKELAPVQAWFDLASKYPLSVLLRQDVIDELKRGFTGVVKCLYFGAVMERGAYESVASRILDPIVASEAAIDI